MEIDLIIDIGTPVDAGAIAEFNCAMAAETEDRALDRALVDRGVRNLMDRPEYGFYLIAKRTDGTVVGSLMITYEWSDWRNGLFWWIQSVYVRPEHRQQGVYSRLHNHARDLARAAPEVCGLRLYVEAENDRAQFVYRSLGMHETSYGLFEEDFSEQR